MATVIINLSAVNSSWKKPCQQAVKDLNLLFSKSKIGVVLANAGSQGPIISVRNDATIIGDAVHGRTSAEVNGAGRLQKAEIRLPVKITINTPSGVREAGPGVLEVIAAHEIVHALGDSVHTSHLMTQTMQKDSGAKSAGDKLKAAGISMPPLVLSPESISALKQIWP